MDEEKPDNSIHSRTALGIGKLLVRLASVVFSRMRIEHSYNKQISILEKKKIKRILEKKEEEEKLVSQIFTFLLHNESAFVRGLMSVTYAVGDVGFRKIKPAVETKEGYTEKQIIEQLLKRKKRYLRFTPTINKQAILQDARDGKRIGVLGVRIRDGSEMFISLKARGELDPKTITHLVK